MEPTVISLYDSIHPWTYDDHKGAIDSATDNISVEINSAGGEVLPGVYMHSRLVNSKAKVTVDIQGIAGSIASVIAMAGEYVKMASHGIVMIHNISGGAVGEAEDMKRRAKAIEALEGVLVGIYKAKTGLDEAKLKEMMAKETWLNAQEAKELGFVDEIYETNLSSALAAMIKPTDMVGYYNDILKTNNKVKITEDLRNQAGVGKDATPDQVLEGLSNKLANSLKQVSDLKKELEKAKETSNSEEVETLTNKIATLEDNQRRITEERANDLVNAACDAGKFMGEAKNDWLDRAKADYDGTKSLLASIPARETIGERLVASEIPEDRKDWTFTDWSKKDSDGLKNMKENNFTLFNKLYKAEHNEDYQ